MRELRDAEQVSRSTGESRSFSVRRALRRKVRLLPYLVAFVLLCVLAYDVAALGIAGILVWLVAAGVREWRHGRGVAIR